MAKLKMVSGAQGKILVSDLIDRLHIVFKDSKNTYSMLDSCSMNGGPLEYKSSSFLIPPGVSASELLIKIPDTRFVFNYTTRQRKVGATKFFLTSSASIHMPRNRVLKHTLFEIDSSTITDSTKFRSNGDITLPKGSYMYIAPIHIVAGSDVITITTNQRVKRLYKTSELPQYYKGLERAYNTTLMNGTGPHPVLGSRVLEEAANLTRWQAKN